MCNTLLHPPGLSVSDGLQKKMGSDSPKSDPVATRVACPKVSLVLRRNAR